MQVTISNQQDDLLIDLEKVELIVIEVLKNEGIEPLEVSISFVDEEAICHLHEEYFDDPSFTDCISFPMDDEVLGEVVVCPLAAIRYVKENGGEVYRELTLYLIHGLMHLIGLDDIEDEDETEMRAAEEKHLLLLEKKGLSLL